MTAAYDKLPTRRTTSKWAKPETAAMSLLLIYYYYYIPLSPLVAVTFDSATFGLD